MFALIFGYFAVPAASQRRVIFWGIVGAIVLRALFILAGAALLDAFHYAIYLFGAFLVLTGIRMARHSSVEIHPERNPAEATRPRPPNDCRLPRRSADRARERPPPGDPDELVSPIWRMPSAFRNGRAIGLARLVDRIEQLLADVSP